MDTISPPGGSTGITYDALDRMVEQNTAGSYKQFIYSPTGFKMQIMNGATSLTSFVPLPGGASIVYISSGYYFRHADWLGSSRFSSTSARAMYSDKAYAPFGEPYAQAGATNDLNFTGMNSDTSSGLYDFLYREYSTQGRWSQPDPAGLAAVDPTNPQSWNRYAYVTNSPLSKVDPLGMDDCDQLYDAVAPHRKRNRPRAMDGCLNTADGGGGGTGVDGGINPPLDPDNPSGSGGTQICVSIGGQSQGCGYLPPPTLIGNDGSSGSNNMFEPGDPLTGDPSFYFFSFALKPVNQSPPRGNPATGPYFLKPNNPPTNSLPNTKPFQGPRIEPNPAENENWGSWRRGLYFLGELAKETAGTLASQDVIFQVPGGNCGFGPSMTGSPVPCT